MKKEEAGSEDWQRFALSCCRNKILILQLFLISNSIIVNIFFFGQTLSPNRSAALSVSFFIIKPSCWRYLVLPAEY